MNALLALTRGKSLSRVLELCRSSQVHADTCFESPEAMKEVIKGVLGDRGVSLLEERLDLITLEQLIAFADGLSKGFAFNYAATYAENGDLLRQPRPFYDINLPEDEGAPNFHIEGLLPGNDVHMMIVHLFSFEDGRRRLDTKRCFYYDEESHPDPDLILRWIARLVIRDLKTVHIEMPQVTLFAEHDEIDEGIQVEIDIRQPIDQLIDIIMNVLIQTGAHDAIADDDQLSNFGFNLRNGKTLDISLYTDYYQF